MLFLPDAHRMVIVEVWRILENLYTEYIGKAAREFSCVLHKTNVLYVCMECMLHMNNVLCLYGVHAPHEQCIVCLYGVHGPHEQCIVFVWSACST